MCNITPELHTAGTQPAKTMELIKEGQEVKSDPWIHRSKGMQCRTCMWFVEKVKTPPSVTLKSIGRCRKHAPTINGYPVVYLKDWCGDHKVDENK